MIRLPAAIACLAAICLALAALLGGTAPFGRIALALGVPGLARPLLTSPDWAGIAAHRNGDFANAARLFMQSRGGDFNAGVAQARAGRFAASLEAFDRAIADYPGDAEARANFDLIAAIYGGTGIDPDALVSWSGDRALIEGEAPVGLGTGRASAEGDEVTNSGTNLGLPQLKSRNVRTGVRKVFDDRFIIANDRWLRNLADVPGEYLAARIKEEHKRRQAMGLSPPEAEDVR